MPSALSIYARPYAVLAYMDFLLSPPSMPRAQPPNVSVRDVFIAPVTERASSTLREVLGDRIYGYRVLRCRQGRAEDTTLQGTTENMSYGDVHLLDALRAG